MAIAKRATIIGIEDAKIKVDTVSYDVPGIEEISLDFEGLTQKVEGDEKVVAFLSVLRNAKVSVKYAVMSLEVLATITGGTITDNTTNLVFDIKTGQAQTVSLEGRAIYVEGLQGETGTKPADVHIIIPVLVPDITTIKWSFTSGKNVESSFSGIALPDANGVIATIKFYDTLTAIT